MPAKTETPRFPQPTATFAPTKLPQPSSNLFPITAPYNPVTELERCSTFLDKSLAAPTNQKEQPTSGNHCYRELLEAISQGTSTSFLIDLDDVADFPEFGVELASNIQANTLRYVEIFSGLVQQRIRQQPLGTDATPVDIMIAQRTGRLEQTTSATDVLPAHLLRRFTVGFTLPSAQAFLSVRQVRSSLLGTAIRVRAVVTRVAEVRPLLVVATYTCESCANEIYQECTGDSFTPLLQCPSAECRRNGTKGQLFLQTRASRFQRFQEIRLQEQADQVPVGHIPRSITCFAYESMCRTMTPGDCVLVDGIFLPRPFSASVAMRVGLLTDSYVMIMSVRQQLRTLQKVSPSAKPSLGWAREQGDVYEKLASSIAPEIYGHLDVKKALLLQMVGGVDRKMKDGMGIRGAINVLLIGDPGVAKSQLLRFVTGSMPRSVYTTGRGSSGVGLTAAVTRDATTGELVLEGGALVLADNGICAIDEFDKMHENDRTAIHEVMEQQTISISKAGITTTLNARCSVLAAANPPAGRYNKEKSPKENIGLPAALLSRFDVLFVLIDDADEEADLRLAQHVCTVHRTGKHPVVGQSAAEELFSPQQLTQIIAAARQVDPIVPDALAAYLADLYTGLRTSYHGEKNVSAAITPRTLLAIVRLASARARLRFSAQVTRADVDEAVRLLETSHASADASAHSRRATARRKVALQDAASRAFRCLQRVARDEGDDQGQISLHSVYSAMRQQLGIAPEAVDEHLAEFQQLNLCHVRDGNFVAVF